MYIHKLLRKKKCSLLDQIACNYNRNCETYKNVCVCVCFFFTFYYYYYYYLIPSRKSSENDQLNYLYQRETRYELTVPRSARVAYTPSPSSRNDPRA